MSKQLEMPLSVPCTKCALHLSANHVCLMGVGPKTCKVMIIGEAPGRNEDQEGEPFVGRSGDMLNSCLHDCGIDRDDIYITNAVHCRPPDNRTPSRKEIATCKEWLMKEVHRVKPQFILTMGNIPLQALLNLKGVKKLRGKPLDFPGADFGLSHEKVYVFPTYHPSYALRDPRNEPVLRRDIKQFFDMVARGGPRVQKGLSYRIVESEADLVKCIEDIEENRVLSWDLETSGLDPLEPGAYVTSFGVGTSDYQWCIPLNHTKGRWYRKHNTQRRWVQRLVAAMRGKYILAHNGKFDTRFLATIFGIWLHVDFDTMLAHYQLDENSFHGLDILASQYFGAIDYDIPMDEKHGFGPLDRHCEYLALDLFYTRNLYPILKKKLKNDPSTECIFYDLTMPVARMYAETEHNGVYVNPQRLKEARAYWIAVEEDCFTKLNKLVPDERTRKDKKTKKIVTGVNWNSADQVAEVLFGRLGMSPLDMTAGGKKGIPKASVAESVLLRLASQHQVPSLILKYREAVKNRGTFVEGWQKRCYEGRMHPNFKVHGTVTGRPSCEDPNLQQTPRDPRLRTLIDAPPGWVLVDADLSQAELRIAAEMADERELKLSYQTGVDVHSLTVQRIFGIMKPTSEERKKGKAINFGFVYGMGWRKFQIYARDNYGVDFSEAECKRIRKHFFRLYADLPNWHGSQRRFANRNGYVRSLLGRMRRLPDAMMQPKNNLEEARKAEAERQAINSPVQSLASDINLMASVELHERFGKTGWFRMIGTIHDAILMEVRADKLHIVLPAVKRAMENPRLFKRWNVPFSVPIIAEVECGPWGAGKKWDPDNTNFEELAA